MPFAPLNGTALHYNHHTHSDRTLPTVVFLHAGICDSRMWAPQLPALTAHFPVVAYDRRGFGLTPMTPPGTTPIHSHLDDLLSLLDHLQIAKAHLVGCSMGGSLAIDFALAQPGRTASLTTICSMASGFQPSPDAPPIPDAPQAAQQWEAFKAGNLDLAADLDLQLWVAGPDRPLSVTTVANRALVRDMDLIALRHEYALYLFQQANPPTPSVASPIPPAFPRLHEITAPTLVLTAEHDEPFCQVSSPAIAAGIHGARHHILPTAHLPNLELPEVFNRLLSDFLRNV